MMRRHVDYCEFLFDFNVFEMTRWGGLKWGWKEGEGKNESESR